MAASEGYWIKTSMMRAHVINKIPIIIGRTALKSFLTPHNIPTISKKRSGGKTLSKNRGTDAKINVIKNANLLISLLTNIQHFTP
jgi:hypothetical protein